MKKFIAFLVAATAVIALAPQLASAKTGTLTGLYNTRYCEIFTVTRPDPPNYQVDVYNTVGLNDLHSFPTRRSSDLGRASCRERV